MKSTFALLQNAVAIPESEVPILPIDIWRQTILDHCLSDHARLVALFGSDQKGGGVRAYCILGADHTQTLFMGATDFGSTERHYESLTPQLLQAHLFERELYEEYQIMPTRHPWIKPVRMHHPYPFYKVDGEEVHEVAVGPVHAGIIEPGHFRFQCHGETILNLEIRLGYQHRGVEDLMRNRDETRRAVVAESVAGDTVIGHGLAYAQALEGLAEASVVTERAHGLRGITLELERLANHSGDLGALANDIGFLPASAYFGRLRGEFLNLLMELTGSRFGRSFVRPGGVLLDMTAPLARDFEKRLRRALKEIKALADLFFDTSSVLSRLESTGTLSAELAKKIGAVGLTARASHLPRDVRQDHPFGIYRFHSIPIVILSPGDVYARARLRSLESKRSLEYLLDLIPHLPAGAIFEQCRKYRPSSVVVSLVEGWRGEIVHLVVTDERGDIARYKIIDPSFHNWVALELVMRNGQISDFPLCNKSFNLSYAGHDL